jgi:hypothetical protein
MAIGEFSGYVNREFFGDKPGIVCAEPGIDGISHHHLLLH